MLANQSLFTIILAQINDVSFIVNHSADTVHYKLQGKISDSKFRKPIAFAVIEVQLNGRTITKAYSSADGIYTVDLQFPNDPTIKLELRCMANGFRNNAIYIGKWSSNQIDHQYTQRFVHIVMHTQDLQIYRCRFPISKPPIFPEIGNYRSFSYREIEQYNLGRE